jgi:hypothetical protein
VLAGVAVGVIQLAWLALLAFAVYWLATFPF